MGLSTSHVTRRGSARPLLAALGWVGLAMGLLLMSPSASAHGGFGGSTEARFSFPPWVIWAAGGFLVALSFAVVGAFLTRPGEVLTRQSTAATARKIAVSASSVLGMSWSRMVGTVVLLLVIGNGFHPGNTGLFPATILWLVLWVVLPLVAYTVGDLWPHVSPFHGLARWAETARGPRKVLALPQWVGAWPATGLLAVLVGLEVSGTGWAYDASSLGLVALAYTLVTLVGIALFGADPWLTNAEVFTRMMKLWSAVSPLGWAGRPTWRGFSVPLARVQAARVSDVAFVLVLLLGVNFDGFLATPMGAAALQGLAVLWGSGNGAGVATGVARWSMLTLGLVLFSGVWILAVLAARRAAPSLFAPARISRALVPALLPIAAGYHLAHNVFTLAETLPTLGLVWLDPLGFVDWTGRSYQPGVAVAGWAFTGPGVAATQIALILCGHFVAVLVAHRLAERTFPGRIMALRAELPLTVVMVVYTWAGLWILTGAGGPIS